jgi:hypothetical protein
MPLQTGRPKPYSHDDAESARLEYERPSNVLMMISVREIESCLKLKKMKLVGEWRLVMVLLVNASYRSVCGEFKSDYGAFLMVLRIQ